MMSSMSACGGNRKRARQANHTATAATAAPSATGCQAMPSDQRA